MTTAKNAVFIGLKLENCCSEVGEIKIWGEGGGGVWSLLWGNFYRWGGDKQIFGRYGGLSPIPHGWKYIYIMT